MCLVLTYYPTQTHGGENADVDHQIVNAGPSRTAFIPLLLAESLKATAGASGTISNSLILNRQPP